MSYEKERAIAEAATQWRLSPDVDPAGLHPSCMAIQAEQTAEIDRLHEENAALEAALDTYGHHINVHNLVGPPFIECASQRSWQPEDCDCGFKAALARVRGAE